MSPKLHLRADFVLALKMKCAFQCWECTVCVQTLGEISGREQQAIVNMCVLEGRKCVHNVRQGGNICVGKKCMHMQQGGFTGPGHGQRLTRNNMCSTSAQA